MLHHAAEYASTAYSTASRSRIIVRRCYKYKRKYMSLRSDKMKSSLINMLSVFVMLIIVCEGSYSQEKKIKSPEHHKEFLRLVKNACVTKNSMDYMHFCFKNGYYKVKAEDGDVGYTEINIVEPIVYTYFDSDTLEYAIVPMSFNGSFYLILLFAYENGKAVQIDWADVSDSSGHGRFESIRVDGHTVLVDVDDSPHVTNKYSFENNKLTVLK